jgi:hypothetical protein
MPTSSWLLLGAAGALVFSAVCYRNPRAVLAGTLATAAFTAASGWAAYLESTAPSQQTAASNVVPLHTARPAAYYRLPA